jgi:prevent-host-death family protein
MKSAAVSTLKATLSACLAKVKAGEEVIVMERGKPIAKLVPLPRHGEIGSAHLSGSCASRVGSSGIGKAAGWVLDHAPPARSPGTGGQGRAL